jgi:tetratricopeptide (TPR) repeat protein
MPDFDISLGRPDPEAAEPYAETMIPPPSDVVVPVPIVSELPPALEKEAGNSIDLSAGIALPASSLQVPDPDIAAAPEAAPVDPVTVVAAAIADAPAVLKEYPKPRNDPPPRIEVHNVSTPIIGNLIDEAQAKLEAGDAEGAIADYNRILAHDRHNHPALTGLAFAAQRAGDYAAAAKANRGLLALDPDNDAARINLVAALGAWDAPPALKELQHMAASSPDYAPAQMALAEALARQGQGLAALAHAKRAVELDPDNIVYTLDLAATYDKLGHSGEAIEQYEQVLKASDEAEDGASPALPVSRASIRQRVNYLEKLMASAQNLAAQQ